MEHARKVGRPVLGPVEEAFKRWAVPQVPLWCETQHLTGLTAIWSVLAFLVALASSHSRVAVLVLIPLIVLQYVTDVLDGAVGRLRDTGLVRWGFYFDHILDFVFMSCAMAVWTVGMLPHIGAWAILLPFAPLGCFFHAFLFSGAKDEFCVYYNGIGPTEGRLWLIFMSGLLALCPVSWIVGAVVGAVAIPTMALVVLVAQAHLDLWEADLHDREWPHAPFESISRKIIELRRTKKGPIDRCG